jgi:O-antigen/teichoic acid export membrane protein
LTEAGEGGGAADAPDGTKPQDVTHAARSGAMQALTIAAQAMLTITQVLLARLFGKVVFGSYQTCLAIMEVLTRGGTGGADKGMLRYIAAHRASGEHDLVASALGTGLRVCLLISSVAVAVVMLAAGPLARLSHAPTLATGLRVMAPAAIFTGCMWVLVQASLASKITRANFLVRGLGEPSFFLIAGLTAALFGRTLEPLAVAHLLAAVATFGLAVVVVGRVLGRGELGRALRAPRLPGFAQFSIPLGLSDLMNAVLQRTDIIMLTVFRGPAAAAVYAAGEFVTRVIANARYALDSVAAPVFSEAVHLGQPDRLRQNWVMMTRWVASASAPIAITVVMLRHELLAFYGRGFQEGASALCVLAVGHLINSTFGLVGWILMVSGRSRVVLANNVVGTLANMLIAFLLIPRLGLVGTAVAALSGVALLQTMMLVEVWIILKVHPFHWSVAKPFISAALALGAQSLIAPHLANTALRICAVIIVGLGVYLGALLTLKLAPEDRRVVDGLVARVRRWAAARR